MRAGKALSLRVALVAILTAYLASLAAVLSLIAASSPL